MERSVKDIGRTKWEHLPVRQRHTALARYVIECVNKKEKLAEFMAFYKRVISWTGIDSYTPPEWLTEQEAYENLFIFHQQLSGNPTHYFRIEKFPGRKPAWKPRFPVKVVLDQVLTPFNVGSILRLVDNFGFEGMVHSTAHLKLTHPNLMKSGRGTQNWIPVEHHRDLYGLLKDSPRPVVGLELSDRSVELKNWDPPNVPFYLVLGNEAYGISRKIVDCCHHLIYIPMEGFKHSMNLSHCLAVTAEYIRNKLK